MGEVVCCAGEFFSHFFFFATSRFAVQGLAVCNSGDGVSVRDDWAWRLLKAAAEASGAVCVCHGEADVSAGQSGRCFQSDGDGG